MKAKARKFAGAFTIWSLVALALGLLLGLIGHASDSAALPMLARAVRPLGDLWMAALQMTVLPLVVFQLLAAIVGTRAGESMGALGARAMLLFIAMALAAGLVTVFLAPPVIHLYRVDPATVDALGRGTTVPAEALVAATRPDSLGDWVGGLLPTNLLQAALERDILPLLLFTALFGIALTRLPDEQRDPIARAIMGMAAAMLTLVRWVLWLTPFGVFAFVLELALGAGGTAAGMLGAFVVIVSGFLLLVTILLYPATVILGRASLRAFARAVAPAQLVAVSTRSSLASLPALVEGGRDRLRLPTPAIGLVLPLSVSIFKINLAVSSTIKFLFLAHVYAIGLDAMTIATFVLTIIAVSFGTPGVPSAGSAFKSLPAYLAAGIPIEGFLILIAVDTIPDIFKTLLNVTADMSAATILSRSSRTARGLVPGTEPVPGAEAA